MSTLCLNNLDAWLPTLAFELEERRREADRERLLLLVQTDRPTGARPAPPVRRAGRGRLTGVH